MSGEQSASIKQESTPSLSFVWEVFKESDTSAKLILPDLLSNPFYMPSPRGTKAQQDAKFEKDMRRLDLVFARDCKYTAPSDRRNSANLVKKFELTGKERAIEKRLLDNYRKDAQLRAEFVQKMTEKETKLAEEQALALKPKPPPESKPVVVSREARHTLVIQRRTVILETVEENIAGIAQKLEEKRAKVEKAMEELHAHQAGIRVTRWLQFISTINSLRVFFDIIQTARLTKALSPARWNACMKIQKWFRKVLFFKLKRHVRGSLALTRKANSIVKMLREAALKSGGTRCLVSQRQLACTTITVFLRELQGRMSVYVRKFCSRIRNLQKYLKNHFRSNALRIQLLERLFEVCLPTLLLHMEVVLQGRGHDLHNLTSYDQNKLSSIDRLTARTALVHRMNNPAFHAYLRSNLSQLPNVLAVFKMHGGRSSRAIENGKEELFELLQKKRRGHILDLAASKIVKLNIPMFDASDVTKFIHGGEDPLEAFLANAQRDQNAKLVAEELARLKAKGKARRPRYFPLLLVRSVTMDELVFVAMSVAAKLADSRANARAHGMMAQKPSSASEERVEALLSRSRDSESERDAGEVPMRMQSPLGSSGHPAGIAAMSPGAKSGGGRNIRASERATPRDTGKGGKTPAKGGTQEGMRPASPPAKAHNSKAESPQKARRRSSIKPDAVEALHIA